MKHDACKKCAASVGTVNIVGNILMIALKGYMGVIGGSKGLIADAIHSCADLLATIVMIIGMKISSQEKDEQYPYGYGKSEHIVAILIYIFLFFIAGYILYDGIFAILENRQVTPCLVSLWGALFSIAINELMFRQSSCAGTQINSPSMLAKAWESRTDVYSSIAVVIGIIGAKLGFHFMDPLAAVVVGLLILKICIEMTKEAMLNLMDKVPEEIDLEEFRTKLLEKADDILLDIRNVWVREVGGALELNVEVDVPDCLTVNESEEIKIDLKQTISTMFEEKSHINVLLVPMEQESP
jgi:cation diffusion facilitator family transporter